jgi:hypothetical protein
LPFLLKGLGENSGALKKKRKTLFIIYIYIFIYGILIYIYIIKFYPGNWRYIYVSFTYLDYIYKHIFLYKYILYIIRVFHMWVIFVKCITKHTNK